MNVKIFIITLLRVYKIYGQSDVSKQENFGEDYEVEEEKAIVNSDSEEDVGYFPKNDADEKDEVGVATLQDEDDDDKRDESKQDNLGDENEIEEAKAILNSDSEEDVGYFPKNDAGEKVEVSLAKLQNEDDDDKRDESKQDNLGEESEIEEAKAILNSDSEEVPLYGENDKVDLEENLKKHDVEEDDDKDNNLLQHRESHEKLISIYKHEMEKEHQREKQAGSASIFFGVNQHYQEPSNFDAFGRRFVLSYPYIEINNTIDHAETKLDNDVKEQMRFKKHYSNHLTPLKAPPEFVLSIAKQSAILEAAKPENPSANVIAKDILRTGNYWNNVWKENVDKKTLRTSSNKSNRLEKVTVEIEPGSKLYELVSVLKKKSPVLLYVINKNNAD